MFDGVPIVIAGVTLVCSCLALYLYTRPSVPGFYSPNSRTARSSSSIKICSLTIFPVKSLRGVSVQSAEVTPLGLKLDREWVVVRAESHTFASQRTVPSMARVSQRITEQGVWLASAIGEFLLPITPPTGPSTTVSIWGSLVEGVDVGQDAARFITESLKVQGKPVQEFRILRLKPGFQRPVEKTEQSSMDNTTGFADGFPFLLASLESITLLNKWILNRNPDAEVCNIDRFRPNIVVSGTPCGFSEDIWKSFSVSGHSFRVAKSCTRCIMPTTNQQTGKRHKHGEPSVTLKLRRMDAKGQWHFGQNLVVTNVRNASKEPSFINVGDSVTIDEYK